MRSFALACVATVLLAGCGTTSSDVRGAMGNSPAENARRAQILAEPSGSHYIGRRFHIAGTRFWGYVRRPRQAWTTSKLVVISEAFKRSPDRLPEEGDPGRSFAYDHNYEYRLFGRYSGKEVYDPNSNLFLPEFVLTGYQLISAEPGWLFKPNETDDDPEVLPFISWR